MNPEFDDNRQINPTGKPPLSEKDFIAREVKSGSGFPPWVWLFLAATAIMLVMGSKDWYSGFLQSVKERDPFLEVTNREFSVFLWHFPSFMRSNVTQKTGYLPGFLGTSPNFEAKTAEDFVSAPPDLIFLYHTWHRLLTAKEFSRSISPNEFDDFLAQVPEWLPENWPQAPEGYAKMVRLKSYLKEKDLQSLSEAEFPQIVRQSFIGWKNYFMEGPKINEVNPTFAEVQTFLEKYPHYARNYWRNIEEINHQKVAGLEYLQGFVSGTLILEANVPKEQMAPFLKVALFNAQAQKNNP